MPHRTTFGRPRLTARTLGVSSTSQFNVWPYDLITLKRLTFFLVLRGALRGHLILLSLNCLQPLLGLLQRQLTFTFSPLIPMCLPVTTCISDQRVVFGGYGAEALFQV